MPLAFDKTQTWSLNLEIITVFTPDIKGSVKTIRYTVSLSTSAAASKAQKRWIIAFLWPRSLCPIIHNSYKVAFCDKLHLVPFSRTPLYQKQ